MTAGRLWRARFAFRHAALVCPVNRGLQDAIESYGVRARFRVVPNTVDTRVFHPGGMQRGGSPMRLVNVALHVEVKGLDLLLRALALVVARGPEVTLEFVGQGPLTADLERLARDLAVADVVRFAGSATPAEVAERLSASDVFVLSSHSENMPLSVLEALCCGLPVVATDVGGIPEAVGDDGAIVPSGEVEALALAIEEIGSRRDEFDRDDIARRAAARWSFEAVGGVWDGIYRSLSER
jgi:glycosyltransferase involved in cell wall biosynthesis